MQICRQIRAEFRPLYLRRTVVLCLLELAQFDKVFLPISDDLKENMARADGTWAIDVLPALRAITNFETIKVRFYNSSPSGDQ